MFECIISEYKKLLCILVNLVGIIKDEFLIKMDEKKFDKVIEVNFKVRVNDVFIIKS